jgi:hypothetical protein
MISLKVMDLAAFETPVGCWRFKLRNISRTTVAGQAASKRPEQRKVNPHVAALGKNERNVRLPARIFARSPNVCTF